MFSSNGALLYNSPGVFIGLIGFGLVFFGIFWVLIQESPELLAPQEPLEPRSS